MLLRLKHLNCANPDSEGGMSEELRPGRDGGHPPNHGRGRECRAIGEGVAKLHHMCEYVLVYTSNWYMLMHATTCDNIFRRTHSG